MSRVSHERLQIEAHNDCPTCPRPTSRRAIPSCTHALMARRTESREIKGGNRHISSVARGESRAGPSACVIGQTIYRHTAIGRGHRSASNGSVIINQTRGIRADWRGLIHTAEGRHKGQTLRFVQIVGSVTPGGIYSLSRPRDVRFFTNPRRSTLVPGYTTSDKRDSREHVHPIVGGLYARTHWDPITRTGAVH